MLYNILENIGHKQTIKREEAYCLAVYVPQFATVQQYIVQQSVGICFLKIYSLFFVQPKRLQFFVNSNVCNIFVNSNVCNTTCLVLNFLIYLIKDFKLIEYKDKRKKVWVPFISKVPKLIPSFIQERTWTFLPSNRLINCCEKVFSNSTIIVSEHISEFRWTVYEIGFFQKQTCFLKKNLEVAHIMAQLEKSFLIKL